MQFLYAYNLQILHSTESLFCGRFVVTSPLYSTARVGGRLSRQHYCKVTTNSHQKNNLPLLICENETNLCVHFTYWLIYSTYRHCHGFDSEPQVMCTSSAPLPIFMLVFTFFKSGPRQQTLPPIDVPVTCPLRAIWPTE